MEPCAHGEAVAVAGVADEAVDRLVGPQLIEMKENRRCSTLFQCARESLA
jgi:hypothetical protein